MKNILVPTDYSLDTVHALRVAAELRKSEDVHAILLSVSEVSDSISELLFPSSWKSYDRDKRRRLLDLWQKIADENGVAGLTVSEHHQYGLSRPILNQIVQRFNVDLVVIPFSLQRCRKGIYNTLLGMFRDVKTPFLILPAPGAIQTGMYRALYMDDDGSVPSSVIENLPFHVIQQSMVKSDALRSTRSIIDNLKIDLIVVARKTEKKLRESTGSFGLPVLTI